MMVEPVIPAMQEADAGLRIKIKTNPSTQGDLALK